MGSDHIPSSPPRGHGMYKPGHSSKHTKSDVPELPPSGSRSSRGPISCASQQGALVQGAMPIDGRAFNSLGEPVRAEEYIKEQYEQQQAGDEEQPMDAGDDQDPSWGGSSYTDEEADAVYRGNQSRGSSLYAQPFSYHLPDYYTRGPSEQPARRGEGESRTATRIVHPPPIDVGVAVSETDVVPLFTHKPLDLPKTPVEQLSFHTTTGHNPKASALKRDKRASSLPFDDLDYYKRRRTVVANFRSFRRPGEFAMKKGTEHMARSSTRCPVIPPPRQAWMPVKRGRILLHANLEPPITLRTLSSVDASAILRNGQLRHDLLFESLSFCPFNTNVLKAQLARGRPMTAHSAAELCDITEMYWESIAREIETGCRCSRWTVEEGAPYTSRTLMDECLCGKWKPEYTETQWWEHQRTKSWPSRIPFLISALRQILDSLMGTTTPCPDHFSHSFSAEALHDHEMTCPTVTHALVPKICKALNGEAITRQARRGIFDVELFGMIAQAMKVHCAPVRDSMIDKMLKTALPRGQKPNIARGLRDCMDCLEVMKLDISNHQVGALRPRLLDAAPEHERAMFRQTLARAHLPIGESDTYRWMQKASREILRQASPANRVHMTARCDCPQNYELLLRSVVHGAMQLVFHHEHIDYAWPPVSHQRWLASKAILGEDEVSAPMPESIRYDAKRIRGFYAEAVEIAIIHMLLTKAQQYMDVLWRPVPRKDRNTELMYLASAIVKDIMSLRQRHGTPRSHEPHLLAIVVARHIFSSPWAKLLSGTEREAERTRMYYDTIIELNKYIIDTLYEGSHEVEATLRKVESLIEMCTTNCMLVSKAPRDTVLISKCTPGITAATIPETDSDDEEDVLAPSSRRTVSAARILQAERDRRSAWASDLSEQEMTIIKRHGFQPVVFLFNSLVKRIDGVLSLHLAVYGELYMQEGLIYGLKKSE